MNLRFAVDILKPRMWTPLFRVYYGGGGGVGVKFPSQLGLPLKEKLPLTFESIIKFVSEIYQIDPKLFVADGTKEITKAQQIAMYFTKRLLNWPSRQITEAFGKISHSVALNAVAEIETKRQVDHEQDQFLKRIQERIEKPIIFENIIKIVSEVYQIKPDQLIGAKLKERHSNPVEARQVAVYLIFKLLRYSYNKTMKLFSIKQRKSVCRSIRVIEVCRQKDPEFNQFLKLAEESFISAGEAIGLELSLKEKLPLTFENIIMLVSKIYQIEPAELTASKIEIGYKRLWEAHQLVVYLVYKLLKCSYNETLRLFGLNHPSYISRPVNAVEIRRQSDPKFDQFLKQLEECFVPLAQKKPASLPPKEAPGKEVEELLPLAFQAFAQKDFKNAEDFLGAILVIDDLNYQAQLLLDFCRLIVDIKQFLKDGDVRSAWKTYRDIEIDFNREEDRFPEAFREEIGRTAEEILKRAYKLIKEYETSKAKETSEVKELVPEAGEPTPIEKVKIPLAVLLSSKEKLPLTFENIIKRVSEVYQIEPHQLTAKVKRLDIAHCVAIYLTRRLLRYQGKEIRKLFNIDDRRSVIYAIEMVVAHRGKNPEFDQFLRKIEESFEEPPPSVKEEPRREVVEKEEKIEVPQRVATGPILPLPGVEKKEIKKKRRIEKEEVTPQGVPGWYKELPSLSERDRSEFLRDIDQKISLWQIEINLFKKREPAFSEYNKKRCQAILDEISYMRKNLKRIKEAGFDVPDTIYAHLDEIESQLKSLYEGLDFNPSRS